MCVTLMAPAYRAAAQHTGDNAVIAAADAYGTTVGNQTVGLYSQNDARGFDPQQAGNLRIEGLYYDQQTQFTNPCLFRETTMRVGFAAQSYSFPSPSGIVDLLLSAPVDKPLGSAIVTAGPISSRSAEVDWRYPLIKDRLSASVCVSPFRNFDVNAARISSNTVEGAVLRGSVLDKTEIILFGGYAAGHDQQNLPTVFASGTQAPPLFQERQLSSQTWTRDGWRFLTTGAIVHSTLSGPWTLSAGVFRSRDNEEPVYSDLYLSIAPNRTADHVLDAVPPQVAESISGEARLSRTTSIGLHYRQLRLAVRARNVDKTFGGDSITNFGPVAIDSAPTVAMPLIAYGGVSRDHVRQVNLGLSYTERWANVGSITLGGQEVSYSRVISVPGLSAESTRATPYLPTVSATFEAASIVTVYGSYIRGLEDSAAAPSSAANRGNPPPATSTWQIDGGVRVLLSQSAQLLVGAFEVNKTYYSLDARDIYTQLGYVRHRGVEASFNGRSSDGITIVVGGVYLQPRLRRTVLDAATSGDTPLGPVPLTFNANVDCAPTSWGSWAGSLGWTFLSSRAATTDDREHLARLSTFGLGVRYQLRGVWRPVTVRFDLMNLTNARGLHISPVGAVLPELGRRAVLSVATDI